MQLENKVALLSGEIERLAKKLENRTKECDNLKTNLRELEAEVQRLNDVE
jgi:peptidoglycan hydrolase CwlO-like protein